MAAVIDEKHGVVSGAVLPRAQIGAVIGA